MKMNAIEKARYVEFANELIRKFKKKYGLSELIAGSSKLAYRRATAEYNREKAVAKRVGARFEFDRQNKNSRTVSSAAIRRNAIERLQQIERAKTNSEVDEIIREVKFDLYQIDSMMAKYRGDNNESIGKPKLNSWKGNLRKLENMHPNWRDELQSRMDKSKYANCVAVQRATGCRTEELIRGVRVVKIDDTYELTVNTAKQRVENPDNRLRVIRSTDARLEQSLGEVKLVVEEVVRDGKSDVEYDSALSLAIEKAKKNYRMTMSNVAKRLFGISITPKGFRCAIATDLRASGANTVGVAEFLGHGSTACANTYTKGLNARGKARGEPAVLESPRKKVEANPLSKTLAARKSLQASALKS